MRTMTGMLGVQETECVGHEVRHVVPGIDGVPVALSHRQRAGAADVEREAEQRRAGERGAREQSSDQPVTRRSSAGVFVESSVPPGRARRQRTASVNASVSEVTATSETHNLGPTSWLGHLLCTITADGDPARRFVAARPADRCVGRADQRFDTKAASFAITFHDETSAYRDASVVLMPGGRSSFDAIGGPPGDYTASTERRDARAAGRASMALDGAGASGHLPASRFEGPGRRRTTIAVHAFVMVPATRSQGRRAERLPHRRVSRAAAEGQSARTCRRRASSR